MASSDAEVVRRVRGAVATSLARTGLERSRRGIVVAVSGGADSLCLLDALVAVTPRAVHRLIVGHVDHQLRPDSAADATHVRAAAAGYGLRCETLTVNVPALAEAERRGIEEAARLGRYRALRDVPTGPGTPTVATGHTQDDSIETVLLHLLRGSGRRGLAGLAESEVLTPAALGEQMGAGPRPGLRVVRPLLELQRTDTVAYCEVMGIRFLIDETNADPRMLRNRVRTHLLPVLRTYNPGVGRGLSRLAATIGDEELWIGQLVARAWRRLAHVDHGVTIIELAAWQRQPVAIRRRLVRLFAEQAGFWEIGFDAVERALTVGLVDGPPRAELGGGLIVERRSARLVFSVDRVKGRGEDGGT